MKLLGVILGSLSGILILFYSSVFAGLKFVSWYTDGHIISKRGPWIDVLPDMEIKDADFLQRVLDYSNGNNEDEEDNEVRCCAISLYPDLDKIINYMRQNNLKIAPGSYGFSQYYEFKDGKFFWKSLMI